MSKEIHPTQRAYSDGCKQGRIFGNEETIRIAEEWCAYDAYNTELVCDEHSCDNRRGKVCSAEELVAYLKKTLVQK